MRIAETYPTQKSGEKMVIRGVLKPSSTWKQRSMMFIDSLSSLDQFCERLAHSSLIGLDTEFARVKTYYSKCCLLQISTADEIVLIDFLAFSLDQLDPLLELILSGERIKVIHSARQDLEIFFDLKQALPQSLFDTQVAASLLGIEHQPSYAALVEMLFDKTVDKSATRTDWTRRPLSDHQLTYAAKDVEFLLPIYHKLNALLEEKQRTQWMHEECLQLTDKTLYQPNDQDIWKKVKGANDLNSKQLNVLQQLAAWRELRARKKDLPRKWVVSDAFLLELAIACPKDKNTFTHIIKQHKKSGFDDVYSLIQAALAEPEDQWPQASKYARLSAQEKSQQSRYASIVKQQASTYGIHASIIANRSTLEQLARGSSAETLLPGWRWDVVGQQLAALQAKK